MRTLFILVMSCVSALAQTPLVRLVNTSRPASRDFQVGDAFEILVTGAPKQPISVRTTMNGTTDWVRPLPQPMTPAGGPRPDALERKTLVAGAKSGRSAANSPVLVSVLTSRRLAFREDALSKVVPGPSRFL